LHTFFQNLLW